MGSRFRLLLALSCVVLIQSCGGQKRGTGDVEQTIPVAVRKPLVLDRQSVVRASGSVEPRESAEVGFQVAGRIRRVYFDEGDRVRAGQVLAELDPADYLFGERMAAGQAESAQAQAAKAQAGARRQELEQARIAFEQADDEYRRLKLLFDRNSLAPNDFKKILARRDAALQQYELAQEGARIEDRRAAQIGERQAQLAQAEENLRHLKNRTMVEIEKAERKIRQLTGMVQVAESALAVRQEALRLKSDQLEAGLTTAAVLKEAEAALAEARTQLFGAKVARAISENELRRIVGDL